MTEAEEHRSRTTSPARYSKAAHLTEFYPYLNGGAPRSLSKSPEVEQTHLPGDKAPSITAGMHSRKQSLSSYTSFTPSTLDFRSLVTKTDISHTIQTYDELLTASEKFRQALLLVSEASGDFASALEKGAKCKGAGSAAEGLLSAGGLFFLVANHQQLLAHSIKESFEIPVRKEVAQFKEHTLSNDETFKVEIRERVKELKLQERENAKLSKSKTRNLVAYRSKLMQLTSHIDEIDKLKHEYYQTAFDQVQETSNKILMQVGSVVRAQVEIYEGIARKGWSGGGLDELIAQCPDPFTPDEEAVHELEESPEILDSSDQTLKQKAELTTDGQGLSFNRGLFATKPILSHQQSVQTFTTGDPLLASTPILMSPVSSKSPERENNNTVIVDDNSFSLPVPGSARLKKDDIANEEEGEEEDEEKGAGEGDILRKDNDEANNKEASPPLEEFPVHNEWRDDTGSTQDRD